MPLLFSSSLVWYRIDQSTAFSILESLVSSGNLPIDVLKSIITYSIGAALKSNPPPTTNLHRLLASLQQRHPNIVEGVSRLSMDENEDQEEAIEHLLLSLSVVGRTGSVVAYFLDTIFTESPAFRRDRRVRYGCCVNGCEWRDTGCSSPEYASHSPRIAWDRFRDLGWYSQSCPP